MRSLLSGVHSQNGKGWWGEVAEEKQHQQLETDLGARDFITSLASGLWRHVANLE